MNKGKSSINIFVITILVLGSILTVVYASLTGKVDFSKSELAKAIESEKNKSISQVIAKDPYILSYSNKNYPDFSFRYDANIIKIDEEVVQSSTFDNVKDNIITLAVRNKEEFSLEISFNTFFNTGFVSNPKCGYIINEFENGFSKIKVVNASDDDFEEQEIYALNNNIEPISSQEFKSYYNEDDSNLPIKFDNMKICYLPNVILTDSEYSNEERKTYVDLQYNETNNDIDQIVSSIEGLK